MSSGLRTMQKNILKKAGYHRNNSGDIVNPKGDVVSKAPRDDNGNPVGLAAWPRYTVESE